MLKFFRNIRRRLLELGKVRSYALYAIGEILLVVIGILMALQINNWNEERQDRKEELNALNSLKQEFISNQALFAEMQQLRLAALQEKGAYIELLQSAKFTYADIVAEHEHTNANYGAGTTSPAYGVLNSLISSGNIKLIEVDSLKFALTNWKEFSNDFLENEQRLFGIIVQIWQYRNEHFPGSAWADFSQEVLEQIYLREAAKTEYRNLFIIAYFTNLQNVIEAHHHVDKEINKILNMINERIAELEN